jgi:hypothetical protein
MFDEIFHLSLFVLILNASGNSCSFSHFTHFENNSNEQRGEILKNNLLSESVDNDLINL